ncbi:MAG TPA: glycosyltransferase [Isosphaeraceae bacterium]|nr:glycosyltransferase [Isosphaeraceae bacterium]
MRIALVWPADNRLVDITVRYERYVRGFEELGHQVVTVCQETAAAGYQFPIHTTPDRDALCDPELWRRLDLDAAVIINWLRMPELVAAIKSACPRVVAVSDSDGVVGIRAQPLTILRRMVALQTRWGMKARTAKYWVQLVLGGYRAAERPIIESADESDQIVVTSPGARANLAAVFASQGRPELCAKVMVVPYPVDDEFLLGDGATAGDRTDRVVAIGRWDDPQKDAALLAAAIDRVAVLRPETEFVLIGRNGNAEFGKLVKKFPRVRYLGVQPPSIIAQFLRGSRVLVLSSRWESGPIVASEAVCAGCSLVGPSWVPTIPWYCSDGRHGSLFTRRSASALAIALSAELAEWDSGRRNPLATAAHFRPWFTPINVCRRLLAGGSRKPSHLAVGTGRHVG